MNPWSNIVQAVASCLYVIVTIGGFLLLRSQIKLLRHQIEQVDLSTRAETNGDLYTHQHSIHQFFISNPQFRPFFYGKKQLERTDPEFMTVMTVAEMIGDFSEHIYLQLPTLPDNIRDGWESYVKNLYDDSPALQLHFEEKRRWYSEEFIKLLLSRTEALAMQQSDERITNRSVHNKSL